MIYSKQAIKIENGTIVIHRPILSESEKEERKQKIIEALERFEKGKEISENVSNKSD